MKNFVFFFIIVLLVYGLINFYIGLRGWQGLFSHIPLINKTVYWFIIILLSSTYLAGRLIHDYLPVNVNHIIAYIGGLWLAFMFYAFLIILIVDLVRLINRFINILPQGSTSVISGVLVFSIILMILGYGIWNARNPRVNHYDLTINKRSNVKELHLVMVSDIHLGTIMTNERLLKLVNKINDLNPDLIVFAGDVIDENVELFIEQKMSDNFRLLKSKYGVFAVLGNHEYIGGHAKEAIKYLGEGGVKVLRDEYVKIANSIFIIGRDDLSGQRFSGGKRKSLKEITLNVNREFPMILLDHQPSTLWEAREEGVDLQLSGHTHKGQLFPSNLITERIFEIDWGLLKQGNFHAIISSGYGTWGPPIRIGNYPEIVDITLRFK